MKLCKNCGLVEHELDKDKCIHYQGEYYCSLKCFNRVINYHEYLEAKHMLETKVIFLQQKVDELELNVSCMDDECGRVDGLKHNLEEIKLKIESVYALPYAENNYKESYEMLDNAISDLVEYYNDEVYLD